MTNEKSHYKCKSMFAQQTDKMTDYMLAGKLDITS